MMDIMGLLNGAMPGLAQGLAEQQNPLTALFPGDSILGQPGMGMQGMPQLSMPGMGGGMPIPGMEQQPQMPQSLPPMSGMPEFGQGGLPQLPDKMGGFGLGSFAPRMYGQQNREPGLRERLVERLLSAGMGGPGFGGFE